MPRRCCMQDLARGLKWPCLRYCTNCLGWSTTRSARTRYSSSVLASQPSSCIMTIFFIAPIGFIATSPGAKIECSGVPMEPATLRLRQAASSGTAERNNTYRYFGSNFDEESDAYVIKLSFTRRRALLSPEEAELSTADEKSGKVLWINPAKRAKNACKKNKRAAKMKWTIT